MLVKLIFTVRNIEIINQGELINIKQRQIYTQIYPKNILLINIQQITHEYWLCVQVKLYPSTSLRSY